MANTDYAVAFPVNGQSFYATSVILDSTTGNESTGGLTTLAATVSKDGGACASCTNTPTEIGTTGYVTVLLTATEMSANVVIVKFSAADANAMNGRCFIYPLDLSEPTGHWLTQTIKKLEQGVIQNASYMFNLTERDKVSGTITLYKLDGTTVVGTMARVDTTAALGKGELTNA